MRRLTFIVLALAAIYSAYWFVGARALSNGITVQIGNMQDDGWQFDTSDIGTRGFPSRFDTTASDLTLATPDKGVVWTAPFVQALSLSYRPNAVILAFPERQQVTLAGQTFDIGSDGLKASATVAASTSLALANFTAETGPLTVDIDAGQLLSITSGLVALRPADTTQNAYDVYADLDDLAPPLALRQLLDPTSNLPATFTQVTIDANVTLDRPLDRHALTARDVPRMDALTLNGMTLTWGTMQLRAQGEITIDRAGIPTGRITLDAQNWQQLLDMAVKIGAIDAGLVQTIRNMAGLLAGGSNDLSLPVSFQNGLMSVGPIPVGPAPRLR